MERLFSKEVDKLVNAITQLDASSDAPVTEKELKLVQEIGDTARRLDIIYSVVINGFESENMKASAALYSITEELHKEMEDKEVLIEESKRIVGSTDIKVESIIEYAKTLSIHSKCPLLWTEDMPLDRFPAYPTDSLIQQSILRDQEKTA
ncbi:hypothetical protein NEMIN01_0522 [Nematocida minor]|uniref:uncharacterized protein n=1 Tax=Nematocida minor TaxID=1912983 RepID=UPI0022204564|nr:uncharacterized protein NEMIN01_0522 [Nematocida minor]KAI5189459.1 hypothetical protein NEMIN01_0522 [Nematocida minor]